MVEFDDWSKVELGLLAAKCDALEPFQSTHHLPNASPPTVVRHGDVLRDVLAVRPMPDHRRGSSGPRKLAVCTAVKGVSVSFVHLGGRRRSLESARNAAVNLRKQW